METTLSSSPFYTGNERSWLCRLVFAWIIGSLLYGFYAHTLTYQLQAPVLKYPYVDLTYWLFEILQVPAFITGNVVVAILFDAALFSLAVLCFCYPARRWFIGLFMLLYFIYFIIYNLYGAHHTNPKIGCLLMPAAFLAISDRSFNYLWQSLRYFLCFAFGSAFLWKLLRGSWWHADQGLLIMKKNLAAYLYFNPDTSLAAISRWCLQHPSLVNGLYIAGVLLEGVFLIGFFTRKYDRWLLVAALLLTVGFWFMAHATFFELLILCFTLVNFHRFRYFKQLPQRPL
ncbi:hypothetical protein [Paraflavitalea sp. CAU 1676]|uniref:hypothetical protein n=1 Tax=Paraflavitalea sp. CAU 1676 TaxID=3032598 RepID=UPI0023DAA027|nr:hypothetical protein [Paraflavitalea sp. CAU 1676]MDF2189203.1 hypothetical protein [Paraflavitalea sp. CAU 1676]